MTDGEKMVWAAVFASHYQKIHEVPPELLVPDKIDELKEYEDAVLSSAADNADAAVWHLRKVCEQSQVLPHNHSFIGEMVIK